MNYVPTILLVDDDEITRCCTRQLLSNLRISERVQVWEAEHGAQALALMQAHCQTTVAPQSLLVLLDWNMPVMDGLEFLQHQALLPEAVRQTMTVVVVSGTSNPAEREAALQLAATLLPKPLTMAELTKLLHCYLPAALPTIE